MIICCGEALIDMLPRQSTQGEPAFTPCPGGAVLNTAVALGRLGAPAGYFGALSDDIFGEMIRDNAAQSQVDVSAALRVKRPTTLAFVTLNQGHARYTFFDENSALRMLHPQDLPTLEADALLFGGISLIAEPCGSAFEALMLRERADRVTMIDPNIRPSFIQDEAATRARLSRMIAAADVVKISDEDLTWLYGSGDIREMARSVLKQGPSLVCLTAGAEGAWGLTCKHEVFVPAQPVEVVDTVGAGDTFNAGLLAGLDRNGALTKAALSELDHDVLSAALKLAAAAAAVTVSRAGANPPWAHEL